MLPVLSLRAAPKDAPLLRRLAKALRGDDALRGKLEDLLSGEAAAGTRGRHNYGLFGSEVAALTYLRDQLVASHRPEALYLFGSRAEGRARPDSDFDLLLVLPDARGAEGEDYDKAFAPLLGCGIGADVVPCLRRDFLAEQDIPGTLAYAAKRGRLLYRAGA